MNKSIEIIKNKCELPRGCNVNLVKEYRVIVIENGKKKSVYIFDNEEEATQCYALMCNPNVENEDYMQQEEVLLTINYRKDIYC